MMRKAQVNGSMEAAPRAMIVLPRREGYASDQAGAIALLASRLAQPEDIVVGMPISGPVLPGGQFEAVSEPGLPWRWAREGVRYRTGVQQLIKKFRPDLVEVHNRPAMAHALARSGLPVSLFLHNDPQSMKGARTPAQREALIRKVRVVTVSRWLRERYLEDVYTGDVDVLPNSLDLGALPPRPKAKAPIVLFVGRVVADKGADRFVQAWGHVRKQVPNWRAVMVGADRFRFNASRTSFVDRVEREAEDYGITIAGYQMHQQVLDIMAMAAIVVVPSRWPEPFGLTALEAMASGAAVISSGSGGLPEVVGDAALTAAVDAPDELEEALLSLMQDSHKRANYAARGLERAQLFDTHPAIRRLQALRLKMVNRAGTPATP